MVPMLAVTTAGVWAWSKADSAPLEERRTGNFWALVKRKTDLWEGSTRQTAAERRSVRREAAAMREKMFLEFPELRTEERPVAEEENGFLQLYKACGFPKGDGPRFTPLLEEVLKDPEAWDREKARAALAENEEWVRRSQEIAELPQRSSVGMPEDYNGFIGARTAKRFSDLLLIRARLAAEAKDEPEALRLVAAARNLAGHLREIEEPTLLSETVTLLLDLNTFAVSFTHVLPELGPDANLQAWGKVLEPRGCTPGDFAMLMKGEWNVTAQYYLYPAILQEKPSDAWALARAHAKGYRDLMENCSGKSWQDFPEGGCAVVLCDGTGLSKKSQEILNVMQVGAKAWHKGYVRAASVFALHKAAFSLLEKEKAGLVLSEEVVAELPVDPVCGEAYRFDAEKRILYPPSGWNRDKVEPVKLPW